MSVRGNSDRRRNRLSAPYETRKHDTKAASDAADIKQKPEAALKFLLTNNQAGVLIGTGGSLRRELMEITGAEVHVSNSSDTYPGTNLRCVYITGTGNAVNLAQALLWEMIGQQTHAAASGERSLAWHPAVAKANPGEHDEVRVEGKITIPAAAGGLIVGKGGATIRSIIEESTVEVTIDGREDAELTNERVVSMRGTAAGCMNCTFLILSKMAADDQDYSYTLAGTTYRASAYRNEKSERGDGGNNGRVQSNGRQVFVSNQTRPSRNADRDESDGRQLNGNRAMDVDLSFTAGVPAEMLRAHTTIELAVPDRAIGAIVGVQGAKLAQIEEMSGATVNVSKRGEFVEGTNNRLVTIVGTPVCAQTAHTLIIHKLRQAQHEQG